MLVDNFTSGAQIEVMLLLSVVVGLLTRWQVLIDDCLMVRIAIVEFESNPSYTDREH